tara:strand:+ start:83 stop:418 length:336 start_codon:yes stop_codon:yes gene_type:complete
MESIRQQKIARLLQKEVGEIFNKGEVKPLDKSMISITGVRVSPDLGIARVYISIFPSEDKMADLEKVKSQSSEIRYHLGKKAGKQLRHIPELVFFLDDSFDYAERIDELLK